MNIYERFGVARIINAAGTKTRLGGPRVRPSVQEAMNEASMDCARIEDLQTAASSIIARRCNAEAGFVTSGAWAGLTMAAAACMAGLSLPRMAQLPNTDAPLSIPDEIIIPRFQRNSYDRALQLAGARLIEVGVSDYYVGAGVRHTETWELEAAIGERTVAVAYVAGKNAHPPLPEVASMAERHGIPVIVDAAGQLPPVSNLPRFIDDGAALVVFSGGKALGGPQGTGFVAGRKDLIASMALQSLDMDVNIELWKPSPGLIPQDVKIPPRHGVGRGFKVSREQIVGLLVALELYTEAFCCGEREKWLGLLGSVRSRMSSLVDVTTALQGQTNEFVVPTLEVDLSNSSHSAYQVLLQMQEGRPPIYLGEQKADREILCVHPIALDEECTRAIADRLVNILGS